MLTVVLLDIISFNPTFVYNIIGFLGVIVALVGAFFNLKNEISLLKSEKENMKVTITKLEDRVNNSETKIQAQLTTLDKKLEDKLGQVYDRIEKLPQDLSILFKNIMSKSP